MRKKQLGYITVLFLITFPGVVQAASSTFRDDFVGTSGTKVANWQDATDSSDFNATLKYASTSSRARVARVNTGTWGKVLSPGLVVTVGSSKYRDTITISVVAKSSSVSWKLGIQEIEGAWRHWDAQTSTTATGVFQYNYSTITGWGSGSHAFRVEVVAEGNPGEYIELDYVEVRSTNSSVSTPTPIVTQTFTPTPTQTNSPTQTPTPLAIPVETSDIFYDDFSGVAGAQPGDWYDADQYSDYRANIQYESTGYYAEVIRTASDVWGRVVSRPIRCKVEDYPFIEISIAGRSTTASWRVGVWETGTANYKDLCTSQFGTGVYQFDWRAVTGWSGDKKIQIQVTVEGAVGQWVSLDHVRLFGARRQDTATSFIAVSQTEPSQLAVNGTVAKFKGANYYPSTHGWSRFWSEWDPELIQTELARCQSLNLNLIRTFIHDGEFGGATPCARMVARMEEFIYIASLYGLKVEFSFFPLNRDYSTANWAGMKSHVQAIATRFKGDNRIMGWDVTNEIDFAIRDYWEDQTQKETAIAWHKELAATLQAADAQHVVIAATSWPETLDVLDMSSVDVYTLHVFGRLDSIRGIIMRTKQKMAEHNLVRPILVEELCIDYAMDTPTEAVVTAYHQANAQACYDTDISGFLAWALNDIVLGEPCAPQYCGLYTAAGVLRPGNNILHDIYPVTDFAAPVAVARSGSPYVNEPLAVGPETVLLSSQIPNVISQWTLDNCAASVETDGIRLNNIGSTTPTQLFGCMRTTNSFSVNMDQANDLRITTRAAKGNWFGVLYHEATGYQVRFQADTAHTGFFVYDLKHYVPTALQSGVQAFKLSVGAVQCDYYGTTSNALIESVSIRTGTRVAPNAPPAGTYWSEPFNGTLWVQPTQWQDESEDASFNAHIANAGNSYAVITRTADSTWGKVLSPLLTPNVDDFSCVEVNTVGLSSNATWKLGLQEIGNNWAHWTLKDSSSSTGVFRVDYKTITGWTGVHSFRLELIVESAQAGQYVLADYIKVCQTGSAQGSAVAQHIPLTHTPTMTATPTPQNPLAQFTPTFTPTVTPTSTPWLSTQEVMAYPNPARGRVTFAYTASGPITVTLDLYKINGERVAHISESKDGGMGQTLTTIWEAVDVAPGIYISRLVIRDAVNGVVLDKKKKVALIR